MEKKESSSSSAMTKCAALKDLSIYMALWHALCSEMDSATAKGFGETSITFCLGLDIWVTQVVQGSEWDAVVLPISKGFPHMLYRNLLYTAISRAKRRVVIVGDSDALNMALQ